jgi:hypothetical protein
MPPFKPPTAKPPKSGLGLRVPFRERPKEIPKEVDPTKKEAPLLWQRRLPYKLVKGSHIGHGIRMEPSRKEPPEWKEPKRRLKFTTKGGPVDENAEPSRANAALPAKGPAQKVVKGLADAKRGLAAAVGKGPVKGPAKGTAADRQQRGRGGGGERLRAAAAPAATRIAKPPVVVKRLAKETRQQQSAPTAPVATAAPPAAAAPKAAAAVGTAAAMQPAYFGSAAAEAEAEASSTTTAAEPAQEEGSASGRVLRSDTAELRTSLQNRQMEVEYLLRPTLSDAAAIASTRAAVSDAIAFDTELAQLGQSHEMSKGRLFQVRAAIRIALFPLCPSAALPGPPIPPFLPLYPSPSFPSPHQLLPKPLDQSLMNAPCLLTCS